jgi:hypothetical protein
MVNQSIRKKKFYQMIKNKIVSRPYGSDYYENIGARKLQVNKKSLRENYTTRVYKSLYMG